MTTEIISVVHLLSLQVLGEVGKGYKIAIELLNEGRVGIAAQMIGLAQGAFDATMPFLHQRKQFGQPIADFQAMQVFFLSLYVHHLVFFYHGLTCPYVQLVNEPSQVQYAEAACEIEAGYLLMMNAARAKDANLPIQKEAAMAKYYCAKVCECCLPCITCTYQPYHGMRSRANFGTRIRKVSIAPVELENPLPPAARRPMGTFGSRPRCL